MNRSTSITTKSQAEQLKEWRLENASGGTARAIFDAQQKILTQHDFEASLRLVSQKLSEPRQETPYYLSTVKG